MVGAFANNPADMYAKLGAKLRHLNDRQALLHQVLLRAGAETATFVGIMQALVEKQPARDCETRPTTTQPEAATLETEPDLELVIERAVCPPCGVTGSSRREYSLLGHQLLAADVVEEPGRAILFCSRCGAFGSSKLERLAEPCQGRSATGLALQRARLNQWLYPQSGDPRRLGEPRPLTADQLEFALSKLDPEQCGVDVLGSEPADSSHGSAFQSSWAQGLSRQEILAAFGFNESLLKSYTAAYLKNEQEVVEVDQ